MLRKVELFKIVLLYLLPCVTNVSFLCKDPGAGPVQFGADDVWHSAHRGRL